jgi:hypothetical protein
VRPIEEQRLQGPRARLRWLIGVTVGIIDRTRCISSTVATGISRRAGNAYILIGRGEIGSVIGVDRRAITRLAGQPEKEATQVLQRPDDGRSAKGFRPISL